MKSKYKAVTWEQLRDMLHENAGDLDCCGCWKFIENKWDSCKVEDCASWEKLPDALTASNWDGAEITGLADDELCIPKGGVVRIRLHQGAAPEGLLKKVREMQFGKDTIDE